MLGIKGQGSFQGLEADVGNPHFVIATETPLSEIPLEVWGPPLETHSHFPNRANIEFINILSRDEIDFRVWERGSGETHACGTGATAAVAALFQLERVDRRVTVHLLGGDLVIEITEDDCLMTGSATAVFDGAVSGAWFRQELEQIALRT